MKTGRRLLSVCLCAIICIMLHVTMLPGNCLAADKNGKVVRVAYDYVKI